MAGSRFRASAPLSVAVAVVVAAGVLAGCADDPTTGTQADGPALDARAWGPLADPAATAGGVTAGAPGSVEFGVSDLAVRPAEDTQSDGDAAQPDKDPDRADDDAARRDRDARPDRVAPKPDRDRAARSEEPARDRSEPERASQERAKPPAPKRAEPEREQPKRDRAQKEAPAKDRAPATPKVRAPGAPTAVTAGASDGSALVYWDPPAADGGAPVTRYHISWWIPDEATGWTVTRGADAGMVIITGLAEATVYRVAVVAENRAGRGAATVTDTWLPEDERDEAAARGAYRSSASRSRAAGRRRETETDTL